MNLLIEKPRRLAHGYRSVDNYRLRVLLAASGPHPTRVREPVTTLSPMSPISGVRHLESVRLARPALALPAALVSCQPPKGLA